jgi:DNA-binding transcriptional LysR family regulator
MGTADDMRILLELSRTGHVADAAKRLGIVHTTVSRRISRLEKETGTRLFDRGSAGWQLTEAGRRLVPFAETIESAISAAALDAASPRGGLTGTLRVVAPDGFGSFLLVPGLVSLRAMHPDLLIEVLTATTHDSLTGRDFDVAVTLERPAQRSVAVSKLAEYDLRLYASRRYLSEHGQPTSLEDLGNRTLIWYIDAILDVEPLRVLQLLAPQCKAQVQTNNIAGHYWAVKRGLGVAPLPSYIAAMDPDLMEVLPEQLVAPRTYWLVVPRELAKLARVRAFRDALNAIVARADGLRPASEPPGSTGSPHGPH